MRIPIGLSLFLRLVADYMEGFQPGPQYREWAVGPLSSATRRPITMQFTGCHQPVQRSYWPENAIDWLA